MHEQDDPFAPAPAVDLSGLDAEYEKAEAVSSEEVPDGKYQVKVQGVRMNKTQKGAPMLQYDLMVISGAQQGRHLFKNSVFTPASLPYVKGDLKLLGLEVPKLSELPRRLSEMLDKTLEVTKRTKEDRTNVYFNRALSIPASGASVPEDGIPF